MKAITDVRRLARATDQSEVALANRSSVERPRRKVVAEDTLAVKEVHQLLMDNRFQDLQEDW